MLKSLSRKPPGFRGLGVSAQFQALPQKSFKITAQAEEGTIAILAGKSVQVRQLHQDVGVDPEILCALDGSFSDVALSRGFVVTTRGLPGTVADSALPGTVAEVWSLAKPHPLIYSLASTGRIIHIGVRQIGDCPDFRSLQKVFTDDVIQNVYGNMPAKKPQQKYWQKLPRISHLFSPQISRRMH